MTLTNETAKTRQELKVGIQVEGLRCEYRENPMGIDTSAPRLSWIVRSDQRGGKQTAYQILVDSTRESLVACQGDLWDSGRVLSGETIQVTYCGKRLAPGRQCWWRVRVWDRDGKSSWSAPATWTMGLLGVSKGDAEWIGPEPREETLHDNPGKSESPPESWRNWKAKHGDAIDESDRLPLLRREFAVPKPVLRGVVSVCGLGQYEMYLNDRKVGNHVMDPGWTDYRKTCLYSTYDVTDQIRVGENCLSAMLGNGMYHERGRRFWKFIGSFGPPRMILNLQIDFEDGTTSRIVSDKTWWVAPGPITFSSIFGGEDYDARLEPLGWKQVGFDDSEWLAATIVGGPGGELRAQSAPPVKIIDILAPIGVSEPEPGVFVFDLGQNFSGWPQVSLTGPRGAQVRITPAEVLDDIGLADQKSSGSPCFFTYTLKGEGLETWHPQFTYYGFRYLQVDGAAFENGVAEGRPIVVTIDGRFIRSSARRVGSFSCSNDLFNRIYRLVDWGIGSNLQSVLTDCPHREKLGWLEIAHLMAPSIMYNYDVAAFYSKVVRDAAESQQPDGLVPTIAPEYVVFSSFFRNSPAWGSASVIIPWQLYRSYGDLRVLTECYPSMKRYVDYLTDQAKDNIVALGLGDWGDMPNVEEHMGWAQLTPISLTDTAIYYLDTSIIARSAALLEKHDDAGRYSAIAEDIRNAFNNAFLNLDTMQYGVGTKVVPNELRHDFNSDLFDPVTGLYRGGSQVSQAMPLALGMVEPDLAEAVLANLIDDVQKQEYVTAGDVGHRFLLRALASYGRSDLICKLHDRVTDPGYGWQIEQGCTSLAEAWDGRPVASLNHCQMGHIQEWFHADLLGIQSDPEAVAFDRIIIRPRIVENVRWARGSYDSIRGTISVDWRVESGFLILKVTVPFNTSAIVYVPAGDADAVFESGKPAAAAEGVTPAGTAEHAAVYRVESGRYIFTSTHRKHIRS